MPSCLFCVATIPYGLHGLMYSMQSIPVGLQLVDSMGVEKRQLEYICHRPKCEVFVRGRGKSEHYLNALPVLVKQLCPVVDTEHGILLMLH